MSKSGDQGFKGAVCVLYYSMAQFMWSFANILDTQPVPPPRCHLRDVMRTSFPPRGSKDANYYSLRSNFRRMKAAPVASIYYSHRAMEPSIPSLPARLLPSGATVAFFLS